MCFSGSGPIHFFRSWVRPGIGPTHFFRWIVYYYVKQWEQTAAFNNCLDLFCPQLCNSEISALFPILASDWLSKYYLALWINVTSHWRIRTTPFWGLWSTWKRFCYAIVNFYYLLSFLHLSCKCFKIIMLQCTIAKRTKDIFILGDFNIWPIESAWSFTDVGQPASLPS